MWQADDRAPMMSPEKCKALPIAAGLFQFWQAKGVPQKILVAVSGGSDSMALLRACQHLTAHGVHVEAAIVDHGLRAGSTEEALRVRDWAGQANIPCTILFWEGDKPISGIQAAARAARYRLLAIHAARLGASAILTGHTADDQAETVMMRLARIPSMSDPDAPTNARALAAMRDDTLIAAGEGDPVRLLRPFLHRRRDDLRTYLTDLGQPYLNDPSNDDERFERVRVRNALADAGAASGSVDDLLARAREAQIAADQMTRAENRFFHFSGGVFYRWGGVSMRLPLASSGGPANGPNLDPDLAPLISRLIRAVSGADFEPGEAAAMAALEMVQGDGPQGPTRMATLGGTILEFHPSHRFRQFQWGDLFIYREPSALHGRAGVAPIAPLTLAPGETALFDRRFVVSNPSAETLRLSPIAEIDGETASLALFEGPARAILSLPGLFDENGLRLHPVYGASEAFKSLGSERFWDRVNRF